MFNPDLPTHWFLLMLAKEFIFPVLGPVILATALFYTRHHFRVTRVASHISRFNSSEVMKLRASTDRWLESIEAPTEAGEAPNEAEIRRRINAFLDSREDHDRATHTDIRTFCNHFQELGTEHKQGLLAKRFCYEVFDYLVPHYYERLKPYIEARRTRDSPFLYRKFEMLAERYAASNQQREKRAR
ncbi:DUF4760 domain-containing protein [Mucisphaera sp.]|uniref:DUF4760 domain-containing protein n=1 Tax=Mucisphaera sp. TaxID=2913024 RepID=UPI003D0DEE26